jgi:hypothetical protein
MLFPFGFFDGRQRQMEWSNLVFTENYDKSVIPESIHKERPIVLDPSSPYLNVAKPMDWEVIKLLAQHVLAVLNKAESHTSTICWGSYYGAAGQPAARITVTGNAIARAKRVLRYRPKASWKRRCKKTGTMSKCFWILNWNTRISVKGRANPTIHHVKATNLCPFGGVFNSEPRTV